MIKIDQPYIVKGYDIVRDLIKSGRVTSIRKIDRKEVIILCEYSVSRPYNVITID